MNHIDTSHCWNKDLESCRLGWTIQDPQQTNTSSYSSNRHFVTSALVAEALAVKAALTMASSLGLQHIWVFSDCKALVSLIKKKERDTSILFVLHDIACLANSFVSVSFCFVPRLGNVVADTIAKAALSELQHSL